MEGAEGAPENRFKLPLQTALSTVCGEKEHGVHSNHSTSIVGAATVLEGPGPMAHRSMICLRYTHNRENAHDSDFGITVPPPNPFLK